MIELKHLAYAINWTETAKSWIQEKSFFQFSFACKLEMERLSNFRNVAKSNRTSKRIKYIQANIYREKKVSYIVSVLWKQLFFTIFHFHFFGSLKLAFPSVIFFLWFYFPLWRLHCMKTIFFSTFSVQWRACKIHSPWDSTVVWRDLARSKTADQSFHRHCNSNYLWVIINWNVYEIRFRQMHPQQPINIHELFFSSFSSVLLR